MEALIDLASQIQDRDLREKILSFLKNPAISINTFGDELTIEEAPASKKVHHSYEGGLIEHTVGTTLIAIELVNILQKAHQIDFINKDLVIAGAILQDIYKPLTYTKKGSEYGRSMLGSKIDHTSLIFGEAWNRGFPLELLHIILSHHGKGSAAPPRSLEALIVHLADYVDSYIFNEVLLGARKITKWAGKDIKIENSKFAAMICQIMTLEGISGVKKFLETL